MRPSRLASFALVLLLAAPAAAQELTGTYIGYADIGTDGCLLNGGRSFDYSESGGPTYSCDFFSAGSPVEEFSVEGTGSAAFVARNTSDAGTDAFVTLSGPTVSGRTIRWSGRYTSGTTSITADEVLSFNALDRALTLTVTLTNSGTVAIRDLYYLRSADPDQGACSATSAYETADDVTRQPPAMASALVTAGAGSPYVVLGLGAADARARAHAGGFSSLDPSDSWTTPVDPAGALADEAIAITFHDATLGIGASTTYTMYYVFGPDAATVATRFDSVAGGGSCAVDGAACTSGGASGRCHARACCTGCWDGISCQTGGTAAACGTGGSACASCNDGLACTSDTCDAFTHTCSSTPSSGCLIGGTCYASGATNPFETCQVCMPASTPFEWSPRTAGTRCGEPTCEGGFLSAAATCDGFGSCAPGEGMECPSGMCASSTTCAGGCSSDAMCGSGTYCEASRCVPAGRIGSSCDRDAMCIESSCVDRVCCVPGSAGCGATGDDAGTIEPGDDGGTIEPGDDAGTIEPGRDAGPGGGGGGGGSSGGGSRRGRAGTCSITAPGSDAPNAPRTALAFGLALALGLVTLRRRR